MKKPNLNIEMGWSIFKCMFVLLIFTNLLWAAVHFGYINKSFGGSYDIAMSQNTNGDNNNQSMINGTTKDKN